MSRSGTPTDHPINESLNRWIKEELSLDFGLSTADNVPSLINNYVNYYNNASPVYSIKYKTPVQFRTELGF